MLKLLHLLPSCLASVLLAQAPPSWRVQESSDAAGCAVVVEFAHGFDHDPADCRGLARVLAEVRLAAARRAAPAVRDAGAVVYGDVALVFAAAARPADAAAFVAAALGGARELDDAAVTEAVAKTALAADDAAWLYPGTVLESLARRHLLLGAAARPSAGDAAVLHRLAVAEVRRHLAEPVAAAGWWFGRAPTRDLPSLPAMAWPPPRPAAATESAVGDRAGLQSPHSRIDGPYVAAACVVPADVSLPALALGMEVARSRAIRRLRLTGGEAMARAPAVAWTWREAPPLALFFRRGPDGGEPQRTRAQLDDLLADLRRNQPSENELAAARRVLAVETAGPAGTSSGAPNQAVGGDAGMAMLGRALSGVLAARRGLADVDWSGIAGDQVAQAMAAVLAEPGVVWFELVVMPKPGTR
jgi:hypothetical protein